MTPQRPVVVGVLLYLDLRTMSDQSNQLRIELRDDVRLSAIRECDKAAFVTFLNDRDIYNNTLRIATVENTSRRR